MQTDQLQPLLDFFFFVSSVPPAPVVSPLQLLVELPAPALSPLQALLPAQLLKVSADPEIRHTRDGKKIANMSVATTEKWKDKSSGEQREKTEWHRVVIFNEGIAGIVERYLKKGGMVYLEGAIRTRKWQDQSGQDKYTTEVVLDNFDAKLVLVGDSSERKPEKSNDGFTSETAKEEKLDDEVPF